MWTSTASISTFDWITCVVNTVDKMQGRLVFLLRPAVVLFEYKLASSGSTSHIYRAQQGQRQTRPVHSKTENPKQSNETPFWSQFGSKIESRLYFGRDFNSETGIGGFVSDFRFY